MHDSRAKSSPFILPSADLEAQRHLLDSVPAAVYACDAEGRITYFNQHASRLWGRKPRLNDDDERFCGSLKRFWPDGSPIVRGECSVAATLRNDGDCPDRQMVVERPDGSRRTVLVSVTPFHDEVGRVIGSVNILSDVTDQNQAADLLRRKNDVLAKIASKVSQAEVLNEIVSIVEDQLPGILCSILLVDSGGTHLRVAAAPNLPADYNVASDGIAIGPAAHPCGAAAHRGEPVLVSDIASDPLWADFKDLAAAHGLRACWSIPILSRAPGHPSAVVLGIFACYARRPGLPDPYFFDLMARAERLVRVALESERTDHELRLRESRFRTFVDHAPDAYFLIGNDGIILDVNEEACRSLGFTREELVGAAPTLFGGRGATHHVTDDLEYVNKEGMLVFDSWHRRKDGTKFPVEVHMRSLVTDGRRQVVAFARDMTDRLRAETALRESEAFLRMSQQSARIGSWEWNVVTNRVKWSEELAHIHGISLEDFDGTFEMSMSFFHPDDDLIFRQYLTDLLIGGEFVGRAYRICRADGAIRHLWPTGNVIRDAAGRPTALIGVSVDITERVHADEALRESEKRLGQLAEAAFEGLMIHERGIVLVANQSFAELFGFAAAKELVGKSFFEFTTLTPESVQIVRRQLESPHGNIFELEMTMPDGTVRFLETQGRDIVYQGRAARVAAVRDITEHKQREQALLLFRTLMDRVEDGIEVIDAPTGRFLDVNERGCLDLGYSREELLSRTVSDIDPLVSMEIYQKHLTALRESGGLKVESLHQRQDGSCFPVEISVRLVQLDREYLLAVVRDISERKQYEEALRESEARFRNAFDCTSIGTALVSLDGRWLRVNQSLCNITGYSAEELLATNFQSITHPDDLPASLERVRTLIEGPGPFCRFEKRYIHKRGHVIWALLSVSLVRDSAGAPLYFVSQFQDITDRKETERQLAETSRSREEALALLDSLHSEAPIGVAFVNLDLRYVRCNDALAEINGRPAADHVGRRVEEVLPRLWPQLEPLYEHVSSGKGPILNHEISGETAAQAGVVRHWLVNYYPVRVGMELIGIGIIVHEITEQRRLEEQLRHAHKMEAVGRLAGGIAHDFNNLLTVINGHSQLLLQRLAPGDPQRDGLTAIQDAGERATLLVRQLLAFSGGRPYEPIVLDLNEVIAKSEHLLSRLLGNWIQLEMRYASKLAMVCVDRSQIEQVLLNLVINARDAMPHGGRLTIQTRMIDLSERRVGIGGELKPGRYVRLSITDTGQGMTGEVQARIFEPFFTTKEVGKGTGLGLSVVHGIVQQSGGLIEIKSRVGAGSCLSILLPAEPSSSPQEHPSRNDSVTGDSP